MLNEIILQGRLTETPELKTTNSGKSVTSFSIAVDRDFSTGGEKTTDFINIVAWNTTAEFMAKYFAKGKQIIVKGSLQTRKYTTQNGDNRQVTEVLAEKVYFCGDREKTVANDNGSAIPHPQSVSQNVTQFEEVMEDEDLPF